MLSRNPRLSIYGLSLALLFFFQAAPFAISSAPQSAQNSTPPPPLRVTTRLVEVNVIVNDKRGNPITGLAQKDFTLLDNGKPQEIRMQRNGGRWTGAVQSVFLQLDNAGRVLQADDRTFYPEFDAPTYERVLQTGISYTRQVRVSPGAVELCIVVHDRGSSNIGSIYVPLAPYFPDSSKANRKDN